MAVERIVFILAPVVIVGAFCFCSKNEVPEGEEVPLSSGPAAFGSSKGALNFEAPEAWIQEDPSSRMRHSQYRLPGSDTGGDAELAIFTGIGGSVEQNVERWINQFKKEDGTSAKDRAEVTQKKIGDYAVTLVDITGSFTARGMAPMAPQSTEVKENYRMLAAVIEVPGSPWFLKLTGPAATVERWEDSFGQFLASVK